MRRNTLARSALPFARTVLGAVNYKPIAALLVRHLALRTKEEKVLYGWRYSIPAGARDSRRHPRPQRKVSDRRLVTLTAPTEMSASPGRAKALLRDIALMRVMHIRDIASEKSRNRHFSCGQMTGAMEAADGAEEAQQ